VSGFQKRLAPRSGAATGLKVVRRKTDTRDMDSLSLVRGWLEWLDASGFAEHSIENYYRPVTRFLMIVDHREAALDDLVSFSLTQPQRSAHITYSALRSFFGYAMAVGAIDADPTQQLRSRAQPQTVPRAFTEDELSSLREAARLRDARRAAVVDLLADTGARTAEAVGIRVEDVLPGAVVLRKVKARPGGQRHERVVPLTARARDAVRVLRDAPASSYARTGGLLRVGGKMVYAWVREAGSDAGLYARPHLLRATFATRLAERGVDVRTIQDLLGHTNLNTTQRYVAVTDERRRAAVAVLD
jgi:site-specific recombinase XerD